MVTVSSQTAYGQYSGVGAGTATTPAITATSLSGVGPFTYLWEYVSGDTTTVANSSTSATTTFSRAGTAISGPFQAVWNCRVTDSTGNIGYSPNVTVTTFFS